MKRKSIGLMSALAGFNIVVWILAYTAFRDSPVLLTAATLAYSFGLRHAFDADHIAAIDNITRKLMQAGRRPLTTGLYFSLGHSLVLVVATLAIIFAVTHIDARFMSINENAGVVGTIVSAIFLFAMAMINTLIAIATWRTFKEVRAGQPYSEHDFDMLLNGRGFLSRIFRPLFALANKPWHLLFIGFLFGLGFDTVTEIGLLSLVGFESAKEVGVWALLLFPALFAAGMSLVDTLDGILMVGAYGWAFLRPIRKIYYNLTITLTSIVVALVVGGIEALALIADEFGLKGGVFARIDSLNGNFGSIGIAIVGLFLLSWIVSAGVYRWKGIDRIEVAPPA